MRDWSVGLSLKDSATELGPWYQWLEGLEYFSLVASIAAFLGALLTLVDGQILGSIILIGLAALNYYLAYRPALNRRERVYDRQRSNEGEGR